MKELLNLYILIAEDDADDAKIIRKSFEKHFAFTKVALVSNGEELWDTLKSEEAQRPDVILTDINMPKVDGMEVLERVFHDSSLCRIPFFIYSSSDNDTYKKRSREWGAKGYIVKPFDLSEFDEIPYQVIYTLKKM